MRTRLESELKLNVSSQPIISIEVDLNGMRAGTVPQRYTHATRT